MAPSPPPNPDQLAQLRLQLAEERAAERIRAQVLAMRHREDLLKVVGATYQELLALGVDTPLASIIFVDETETVLKRYAALKHPKTYGLSWNPAVLKTFSPEVAVAHAEEPVTTDRTEHMAQWRQGKTWTLAHPVGETTETLEQLKELFGFDRPMPLAKHQWQSTYVPFKYGWISIWQPAGADFAPLVESMTQTLSLGYLRFLDLQHLEDQNQTLKDTLNQLQQTQSRLILQEKMAALGRLVAGIAHEINTPLGAITSMRDTQSRALDKVRQGLQSTPEATGKSLERAFEIIDQAQQVIANGTDRVATIVRSLQSFVQLDQAQFQQADLHQGLDSTLTLLENRLADRIAIHRDYADLEPIYCAPGQLNQVFMALLENAIAAIDGPGQISIKTFAADDQVHIQIADSGRGIPPEQLATLFNFDFNAADHRVKMGFGLPTADHIVRDHNGQILVESQQDQGTVITVRLPATQDQSTVQDFTADTDPATP